MPREPSGLSLSASLAVAAAVAAAVTGSVLLRRRPLLAIGLLIAASVAFGLVRDSPTVALAHYVAVDVALGFIVATRNRPTRIAVVAWLAGDSVRRARNYAERLRAHAVAEAVTAERLRISRELHDLVAHSMGIITLQAGAAARVIDTQPQRARAALFEVESAGRETLAGLRRMLSPLRQADAGHADTGHADAVQGYQPGSMPGLADIGRLAAATTAAGVHVDVQWKGERRQLPPDFELAAYRIVQESVTNVVRHAGTRSCQVLIADDGEAVSIEVADHGQGPGDGPSGT